MQEIFKGMMGVLLILRMIFFISIYIYINDLIFFIYFVLKEKKVLYQCFDSEVLAIFKL